jgi:peptide/nickel transport system ATP-binding protein
VQKPATAHENYSRWCYVRRLPRIGNLGEGGVMMQPVLEVKDLVTHYRSVERGKVVKAVDGVSLKLFAGEIVGLIGESGCGKSSLGRSIVGLAQTSAGQIILDGRDLSTLRGSVLRKIRSAIQYVFQDPYSSLNDRQTIGETLSEALIIAGKDWSIQQQLIAKLLEQVGLPSGIRERYARELSGGQRQRVTIARALALEPRVLICDEPVSALDLSVRAQVMNLLFQLSKELNLACLLIAHDLALVRQAANRTYIMYLGKIVEEGSSEAIYRTPAHPYSKALLSSVPNPDPRIEVLRKEIALVGDMPSPINPPSGCRFRTRCPIAVPECAGDIPPTMQLSETHWAACRFAAA